MIGNTEKDTRKLEALVKIEHPRNLDEAIEIANWFEFRAKREFAELIKQVEKHAEAEGRTYEPYLVSNMV